jgi:hypothetical protein
MPPERMILPARAAVPEWVWSHLKRSLASLAKRNIGPLTALVNKRMRYRPGLPAGGD